jgi:hypothetical protein
MTFSYLLQNFNDFASGMVTLFDLLIMGNWQIWMDVSLCSFGFAAYEPECLLFLDYYTKHYKYCGC